MPSQKKQSAATEPVPFKFDESLAFLHEFETALYDADRSPATVASYCLATQQFAEWLTVERAESYVTMREFVRAITPTDVRQYRATLEKTKLAPGTINRRLVTLRVLARWARQAGLIEGDPVNGIKLVKEVQTAPRWLDRKEQYALRRAAEKDGDPRNLAIILLMLNTGLRVSEVAGLKLEDVTLGERKGEVVVRGKGNKERTVPLNAEARKALRAYLDQRPKTDLPNFFIGQRRETLGKLGIQYQVATLARLANLEHCTPHTLRHTFAKNLIDTGVSIDRVALLLGHRNLTTTARYTRASQADLAREVEKLGEV